MLLNKANYQGEDGAWYTDDGLYIGGGSNATNGTQEITEDESMRKLADDSSNDAISKLAKELNIKLSNETKDYLYQYYLQRKNDEWALDKSIAYDSSKYQRAVADLKAAGLNPFLAIQSLTPGNNNAQSGSISSGSIASQLNSQREQGTKVAGSIMSMIGIIAAAIIYAML